MSVFQQIDIDLKEAMKSQDVKTLGVLRLLKSAMKNAEIAKGEELSEAEGLSLLEKQAKQRKDSIEQYRAGNREDLAANEEAELQIISKYLPKKMTEDEARDFIAGIVSESGASSIQDIGNVMKLIREKANGQIDGGMASSIVKELLS